MVAVIVYLNCNPTPLPVVSIPPDDIQRLSVRPLKWLRFVMFAICGARGDLSETPGGPAVDYSTTSINDIARCYFYNNNEDCAFVDYQALNDGITSSAATQRRSDFRARIIERDGPSCVITHEPAEDCDAVHLLPRCKGDEYIAAVTQDRTNCYSQPQPVIHDINAVENGMLLWKGLHPKFGRGAIAFLKMPNFALNPDDVPRVEGGSIPATRITLQHLESPTSFNPVSARDAIFSGTGHQDQPDNNLPPALLLDFVYGAAAFKHWGVQSGIQDLIHMYHEEKYQGLEPPPPHFEPSSDSSGDELDDPTDGDYIYPGPAMQSNRALKPQDAMGQAIDNMNMLRMYASGITPEVWAARHQKKIEEEHTKAKEASQSKVLGWMQKQQDDNSLHHKSSSEEL